MTMLRWRVRTVLLLVAVIAGVLGAFAALRTRALARREAILAVDRMHGTYGIRIIGPAWYRGLMGGIGIDEKAFHDPLRVSLGPGNEGYDFDRPIRDEDLEALTEQLVRFPNLELLDLRSNRLVTDRGIASLPDLPRLKQIRLGGTGVTDAGVRDLQDRYPDVEIGR